MPIVPAVPFPFRKPHAARASGYALALASLLVAVGLSLHPLPRAASTSSQASWPARPYGAPSTPRSRLGLCCAYWVAYAGVVLALLAWGRGVGSATGWHGNRSLG
jgi:hypothetical protein